MIFVVRCFKPWPGLAGILKRGMSPRTADTVLQISLSIAMAVYPVKDILDKKCQAECFGDDGVSAVSQEG